MAIMNDRQASFEIFSTIYLYNEVFQKVERRTQNKKFK